MLRSSLALLLVLSAAPPSARPVDRPNAVDGGVSSGRLERADAGRAPVARWQALGDGGALYDGGFTDLVELSVGASVELVFPRQVILTVCDAPIVEVVPKKESLGLVGAEPGATQCGFWFDRGAAPNRFVRVSVEP